MTDAVRKIEREDSGTGHGSDDGESISEERYGETSVENRQRLREQVSQAEGKEKPCGRSHGTSACIRNRMFC